MELRTQRHIIGQHKKTKKISNTDPTKKQGMNSGTREMYAVPASYQTPAAKYE